MTIYEKHTASDIEISYDVKLYDEIEEVWKKYVEGFNLPEMLLFISLIGVDRERRVDRKNKNGDSKHNFSRTIHQRNELEMESIIGLISILSNINKDSDEIINKRAFAKMNTLNMPFSQLPNVDDFYSHLIGGLSPLHELMFEHGSNLKDISSAIYDAVVDNDDNHLNEMVEQLVFEEFQDF